MRIIRSCLTGLVVSSCLLLLALSPLRGDVGPTYAIRNAKIVPVAGSPIEKGTIIIRDGLIEAVGAADKVPIPEDAEIIEAEGFIAYPGLISAHTNLFLEMPREDQQAAPGAAAEPRAQAQAENPKETATFQAYDALKVRKSTVESYLKAGITTVLVVPTRGIFQGQSVILSLNGEKPEPMALKNPFALHINFATLRGSYPSSLMGTMAFIRQSFLDANHYAAHQSQYAKTPAGTKRPEYSPFLETLIPYVRDKAPVIFQCNNQEDIKRAIKLADEFKLNSLITGANEAWRVSKSIKSSKIPLLVTLDFKPPDGSVFASQGDEVKKKAEAEVYPANPAALAKEGIPFALTSLGLSESSFLKNIQSAIKAGLSKDEALKAVTLVPARFLGLEKLLGSLEPGKIADIILTKGDIFEEKTQVSKVFVDGMLSSFETKPEEKSR